MASAARQHRSNRPFFGLRKLAKSAAPAEHDPGVEIRLKHGRAIQLKVIDDAVVLISGVRAEPKQALLVVSRLRVPVRDLAKVREALAQFEGSPPA